MPENSRADYICRQTSKEIAHIDNMEKRVRQLCTTLSHQSYIDRILFRLDCVRQAFKELSDFAKFENKVNELRRDIGEKDVKPLSVQGGKHR